MRLNKSIRNQLVRYASTLIDNETCEKENLAFVELKTEQLRATALRLVLSNCPAEDVKVLKKYNKVNTFSGNDDGYSSIINLNSNTSWSTCNWQRYYRLQLKTDEIVHLPGNAMPIKPSHPFWDDMAKLELLKDKNIQHLKDRLRPYTNLIHGSTSLKQIILAWPEAVNAPIAEAIQLPARLSASDTEAISNDMFARAIPKEKSDDERPI